MRTKDIPLQDIKLTYECEKIDQTDDVIKGFKILNQNKFGTVQWTQI